MKGSFEKKTWTCYTVRQQRSSRKLIQNKKIVILWLFLDSKANKISPLCESSIYILTETIHYK